MSDLSQRTLLRIPERVLAGIFFGLPVLYFLLYGGYGFDDTDQGFVLSLCYRILGGELPHIDFIYVRPPLTPLLHSLELWLLPQGVEIIGMRLIGILYLWGSVLLSVLMLRRLFDFSQLYISPWLLGALGFIISMHNYPPMVWHTIDGVFFTALGVYLMARGRRGHMVAGLLVLCLAPLAKQPFGVVPLAGVVGVLLWNDWREALRIFGMAAGIGLALLLMIYLVYPGQEFVRAMLGQSFGATDPKEIIWPGIQLYIWPSLIILVGFAAMTLLLRLGRRGNWAQTGVLILIYLGFLAFFGVHIEAVLRRGGFIPPKLGSYHGMVFIAGFLALWDLVRGDRRMWYILVMLAGSWSAGISWGYASPVHYMVPAVFMLVYYVAHKVRRRPPVWYYPSLVLIAFVSYFTLYQYPFREPHRSEIRYHLGDLFPEFYGVSTNQKTFAKYAEMKLLAERYGPDFTVFPAMPLANYLTHTTPPVGVDWTHDAELAYAPGLERILRELEENRPIVLVDRVTGPKEAYRTEGHYKSSVTEYVLDNWEVIDEGEYYAVYRHP